MDKTGQRFQSINTTANQEKFRLPPAVSFNKCPLPDGGWAYVFRHRDLGDLGRVVVQERGHKNTQLTIEVAGDPTDPMTTTRLAIFKPLADELIKRFEAITGTTTEEGLPPPPPPAPGGVKDLIESRLIPCERCGTMAAMLIFAPEATDPGRFEDYARKMYTEYTRLNLPTWIIGPALGSGPLIDRPADSFKVWPAREPFQRLPPAEFNPIVERLVALHCG